MNDKFNKSNSPIKVNPERSELVEITKSAIRKNHEELISEHNENTYELIANTAIDNILPFIREWIREQRNDIPAQGEEFANAIHYTFLHNLSENRENKDLTDNNNEPIKLSKSEETFLLSYYEDIIEEENNLLDRGVVEFVKNVSNMDFDMASEPTTKQILIARRLNYLGFFKEIDTETKIMRKCLYVVFSERGAIYLYNLFSEYRKEIAK